MSALLRAYVDPPVQTEFGVTMPVATPTSVSVLLPMYNGATYLAEQVASILRQEDVDVRLLIVDDRSGDNSLALARSLAAGDGRISVFENPKNLGLIGTLERLLALVDTPYFSLSDQDDIWDARKLRDSIDTLEAADHALVYSDVRIIDAFGNETSPSYFASRKIRPIQGRNPVPFAFRNPAIGHTIVARRRVAEAALPLNADLVFHEAWLVAVACSQGSVGIVPGGPLGSYRAHSSNVVGPGNMGIQQRVSKISGNRAHLAQRERTRHAALRSMARLDPTLNRIAVLYETKGFRRLVRLPRYVRFLLKKNRSAGLGSIAVEAILFAYGGLAHRANFSDSSCI